MQITTDIKTGGGSNEKVITEIKKRHKSSRHRKPSAEFQKIVKVEQVDDALINNFQRAMIKQDQKLKRWWVKFLFH